MNLQEKLLNIQKANSFSQKKIDRIWEGLVKKLEKSAKKCEKFYILNVEGWSDHCETQILQNLKREDLMTITYHRWHMSKNLIYIFWNKDEYDTFLEGTFHWHI